MKADRKTIIRRCVDYLHKYATEAQVLQVARLLNVDTEAKEGKIQGNR